LSDFNDVFVLEIIVGLESFDADAIATANDGEAVPFFNDIGRVGQGGEEWDEEAQQAQDPGFFLD